MNFSLIILALAAPGENSISDIGSVIRSPQVKGWKGETSRRSQSLDANAWARNWRSDLSRDRARDGP